MGRSRHVSPVLAFIGVAAVAVAGHWLTTGAMAFLYVPIVVWVARSRPAREAMAAACTAVALEAGVRALRSGLGAVLLDVALLAVALVTVAAAVAMLRSRLQAVTQTDLLTGLPNRRGWDGSMERESRRAARQAYPLTVVLLDIDDFRALNVSKGHAAGDETLRAVAAAWARSLRATDLFARLDADEFAIALAGSHDEGAMDMLSRIRREAPAGITFSVGVAEWDGVETMDELLGRAALALETAKGQGPGATLMAPRPTEFAVAR